MPTVFSFRSSASYVAVSYLSAEVMIAAVCGILFSGLLQRPLKPLYDKVSSKLPVRIADLVVQLALLAFCVIRIVGGSYAPSIYTNF